MKSIVLPVFAAAVMMSGLAACNTVEGAGKDVKATGDAISGTAADTKKDMTDGNPKTP
jgi:entericidin B